MTTPATLQWPFISADATTGGFVRAGGEGEGVFAGRLAGKPERLDCAVPTAPPSLDATGRRLLIANELSSGRTRLSIARLDRPDQPLLPLCELLGSVQQLLWDDARALVLALVAEPGADTASLTSGRRQPAEQPDPEFGRGKEGRQSLWAIPLATGRPSLLSATGPSIWEVALAPDGTVVCICSDQPGEAAWYSAFVGRLDPATGACRRLYSPQWQVAWPAVDQATGNVAFVEGWASDRGLVAGEILITSPDGQLERRIKDIPADVTWLAWAEARGTTGGRLFYAGWQDLGTGWGYVDKGGKREHHYEAAGLLGSRWRPSLALSADGEVALACRSDERTPLEVVVLGPAGGRRAWAKGEGAAPAMSVVEGSWEGGGCQEVHGILLVPDAGAAGLVVVAHGGPTLSYHHGFDVARTNRLVAEGFSVLLPNPRGGSGRGQGFARANFGDPAGAELDDVLAGAYWAYQTGLLPQGKPAIMGASYGGYLSAVAACTRGEEIAAAVVHAGISDIASCRHTANNPPFWDTLMGGAPHDPEARDLYVKRSPVYMAHHPVAPTLVLHGQNDTCVPVGQAHELYATLLSLGGEAELVTYPREGHQLAEADHQADHWARTLRWLSTHLQLVPDG